MNEITEKNRTENNFCIDKMFYNQEKATLSYLIEENCELKLYTNMYELI